jgi:hypothetical protein
MSERDYLKGLVLTIAAGLAIAAWLLVWRGASWFSFYGWASVVLLMAVPLSWFLWQRLPLAGRSRWLALLFGVPVVGLALGQVGYWWAFFRYGATNPSFGVIREVVRMNTAEVVPLLAIGLAIVWLWLFVSAARGSGSTS